MKRLFIFNILSVAFFASSCVDSTSSQEYTVVWKAHSGTKWETVTGTTENFSVTQDGFRFETTINTANVVDSLAQSFSFYPTMYIVSNIETASKANITAQVKIMSIADTLKLSAGGITTHQFGKVKGSLQTFGKDSILTQPRSFLSNVLYSYAPSVQPDSCSKQIQLKLAVNWAAYTGAATIDTLKSKKIIVEVSNVTFTVSGIDVLK